MIVGFILLILALIPALLKRKELFAIFWTAGSLCLGLDYLAHLFGRSQAAYQLLFPLDYGEIVLALNPLSAFFGLIFAFGLPLGIIHGVGYLRKSPKSGEASHLFWLGVLGLSMHGILWARHSLMFLLLWEIMGISSFFAIILDRKESLKAVLTYIITMQIGGAFLMAGFGLLYYHSGSFDIAMMQNMPRLPLYLLMIGFAFKAGFVPLSSWLPIAHPVAPAHVSGIMSSMMIKTGIYGILMLVLSNVFSLAEIVIFATISVISAFWGVIHAMSSSNIKRALAYSSIENIGVIGMGISLGLLGAFSGNQQLSTLAFAGAFMHILFHSFFKALLFYLSGNVLLSAKSLEMDSLGGLAKRMPSTARYFLIGTFAIATLPIGNGFISEFSIYFSMLSGINSPHLSTSLISILMLASLAFIGALALIAFAKVFGLVFLGNPRSEEAKIAQKAPRLMRIPQLILSMSILFTGFFGGISLRFIRPLLRWLGLDMQSYSMLHEVYGKITYMLILLVIIFVFLYFIRRKFVREEINPTWGCGYQKPNPKMQYTSLAFSNPLGYFLKPFILIKLKDNKPKELFPKEISFTQKILDPINEYVIHPISRGIFKFFSLFERLETGKINVYIAFVLIFIILMIIRVLGFK